MKGADDTTTAERLTNVSTLFKRARWELDHGSPDAAEQGFRDLLRFVTTENDRPEEIVLALLGLGDSHIKRNQVDRAIACWNDAQERSEKMGFTAGVLDCLQRVCSAYMVKGALEKALSMAREGLIIAERVGNDKVELAFHSLLGQLELRRQNLAEARIHAMNGLERARTMHDVDGELTFIADLTRVALAEQDFKEALKQSSLGERIAQKSGSTNNRCIFLGHRCQALHGLGKIRSAENTAHEGLQLAQSSGDLRQIATFLHDVAIMARERGDGTRALSSSLESYRVFLERGDREGALASLRSLSRILAEEGDWHAAFYSILDALVLSATMDKDVFFLTFLCVTPVVETLWLQGDHRAILDGLKIIDTYFKDLSAALHIPEDDDVTMMSGIRNILWCLKAVTMRKLEKESTVDEMVVIESSKQIDHMFGTNFTEFLTTLLLDFHG